MADELHRFHLQQQQQLLRPAQHLQRRDQAVAMQRRSGLATASVKMRSRDRQKG